VKANLARFTVAVSLLATMALTLAAGLKWHWRHLCPSLRWRNSATRRCDPAPWPVCAGT